MRLVTDRLTGPGTKLKEFAQASNCFGNYRSIPLDPAVSTFQAPKTTSEKIARVLTCTQRIRIVCVQVNQLKRLHVTETILIDQSA